MPKYQNTLASFENVIMLHCTSPIMLEQRSVSNYPKLLEA